MKQNYPTKQKKSNPKAVEVDAPIAPTEPLENPSGYRGEHKTQGDRILEALTFGMDARRPEVALSKFIAQTMRLITIADEGAENLDTRYLLTVEFLTDVLTDMIEHNTVPKAVA